MFGGLTNKISANNHQLPFLHHAGDNSKFQSGDGLVGYSNKPILLDSSGTWTKVVCARFYYGIDISPSYGIKNGELYAWGLNTKITPTLGDGTGTNRSSPVRIGTENTWTNIAYGSANAYAIRSGQLYSWGLNSSGQLGVGDTTNRSSPVRIGTENNWTDISAGGQFACGIRGGELYAWGYNGDGQLGLGDITSRSSPVKIGTATDWTKVSCGRDYVLAIRNGSLYGWGVNGSNQCGHDQGENYYSNWDPTGRTNYWWWYYYYGNVGPGLGKHCSSPIQVGTNTNWITVEAGYNGSLGIRNTDDIYYWGNAIYNNQGALPTLLSTSGTNVSISQTHGCYINNGSLYTFGYQNNYGTIGNLTTSSSSVSTPYNITSSPSTGWTNVGVGADYMLGINNGSLYGWGYNQSNHVFFLSDYTLNRTSMTKIDKSTHKFNYISCHSETNFGIINGELWGWGENGGGQLGDGTIINRNSPVRIGNEVGWTSVHSGGGGATLGIRDGQLYSWGSNAYGRGGRGGGDSSSPVRIGTESTWTSIGTAETAGFGIREGKLFFWGWNIYAQAGGAVGSSAQTSSPVQIGTLSDWTHVSGSWQHAVGIRDGKLYAWGNGSYGKLGTGNTTTRSSPVQIGTESGWTLAWAGSHSSIGIRDGKLFTWGRNNKGQLGDGTTTDKSSPVQIGTNSDWNWVFLNCGGNDQFDSNHCLAIRNGELYAWGQNINSELGDATTTNRSSPVRIGTLSNWKQACAGYFSSIAIR